SCVIYRSTLYSSYVSFLFAYDVFPALHSFPTRRSSDLHLAFGQSDIGAARAQFAAWIIAIELIVERRFCQERGVAVFFRLGKNRSEEHTSELQSRENLVCRLLLEKKNKRTKAPTIKINN